MHRPVRLRLQISVGVVGAALVVALGVTLLLLNTIKLHDSARASARSDAYTTAVIDVERLVVDAETGLRGYIITRRTLFLAPTRTARAEAAAWIAALDRAATADGTFVPEARQLERSARTYLETYVPTVQTLAAHHPQQARSLAVTLEGKQLVDAVRSQTATLEAHVSAVDRARQRSAQSAADHATTEAVLVLVLLTLLTLLTGAVLGRLVIARDWAQRRSEETTDILRRSLLPARVPTVPECELAVRFLPAQAAELVGGDFYDVFPVASGGWAIVVGDVCGKGADAAAVTAMARWTLRSLAGTESGPADALRFLNRSMLGLDLGGRFITVVYALLTVEGGHAQAEIACAGHPPAILVPSGDAVRSLPAHGTLLGIWPDVQLETARVTLAPGDALVLYTDGVSDPGPGPERMPADALHQLSGGVDAETLADRMRRFAADSGAPQRDDIAILALRFLGERRDRATGAAHGDAREGAVFSTPIGEPMRAPGGAAGYRAPLFPGAPFRRWSSRPGGRGSRHRSRRRIRR